MKWADGGLEYPHSTWRYQNGQVVDLAFNLEAK